MHVQDFTQITSVKLFLELRLTRDAFQALFKLRPDVQEHDTNLNTVSKKT